MSAPCRYCAKIAGPLDTPGTCCEAASDVAALEADLKAQNDFAEPAKIRYHDRTLLLRAMVAGVARWEAFKYADGRRGEVCAGGFRYATTLDSDGAPVLTENLRVQLRHVLSAHAEPR